jgi:hypothetical protein
LIGIDIANLFVQYRIWWWCDELPLSFSFSFSIFSTQGEVKSISKRKEEENPGKKEGGKGKKDASKAR